MRTNISQRSHPHRDFLRITAHAALLSQKFISAYAEVIPCDECQEHYQMFISSTNHDLSTREKQLQFLYTIYSNIERYKQKPIKTFDEWNEFYFDKLILADEKDIH